MKNTKEKIINSAIYLLGQNINSSLEEISDGAGINRRTLHRYFTKREDLIIEVFETLGNEYIEGFLTVLWAEKDTLPTLEALFKYDLEMSSKYDTLCKLYEGYNNKYKFEDELMSKIHQEYTSLFCKLKEEGFVHKSITTEWLEVYYVTMIELGIKQIKHGKTQDECFKMLWNFFWSGIKKINEDE